ncbi:mitochondrial import receptor subunit TOM40 homolog 1-like [Schistocerca piceifrons]|uniref:mitochondrial import receptor subunit TOM40 homolog 1-like n=1 Tax=Schistocerca piceifrons TaxID=274613 RepID=UPI001F5EFD77|nr:mitochondrial import receptor subunit TOM40 homolog 1-like [Schistocerca piceifrons]
MGNSMASPGPASTFTTPPPPPPQTTAAPTPPPPPPTVGFPPAAPKAEDISSSKIQQIGETTGTSDTKGLENPGTVEDLHKKCKDVFPAVFEGARLIVNKGLSNYFQVSHTINLSAIAPSGYRFGATYVGTKQMSPTEAFPVLLGDIDPEGNLNANIIHQFGTRTRTKFAAQIQSKVFTGVQLTTDYKGDDYTASLTFGNLDIINESGLIIGHYLQSVTKNVALGAELGYQYGAKVPGGQIAIVSAVGRYTGNDFTVSGVVGGAGVHVCYYEKVSDQLQFGVEMDTNLRMQETLAVIGYQVDLPKADVCFRAMIDSNWTVGAVLEKKLQPLPFCFSLSGMLNHSKNNFRLGCGITIA